MWPKIRKSIKLKELNSCKKDHPDVSGLSLNGLANPFFQVGGPETKVFSDFQQDLPKKMQNFFAGNATNPTFALPIENLG